MTKSEFQQAMISAAKAIQGDSYIGDEYYLQADTWDGYYKDSYTPSDAVREDMTYWD